MKKILDYKLKVDVTESFQIMPSLHDNEIEEIKLENNILIITAIAEKHDDDGFHFVGFHAKKAQVEFIFDESVDCNVIVSKYFSKKQIREHKKFGHGKKSNCYDIQEFLSIYKDYNLEILYNMVSYNQVTLKFASHNKKGISEVEMEIFCSNVRYTFED